MGDTKNATCNMIVINLKSVMKYYPKGNHISLDPFKNQRS